MAQSDFQKIIERYTARMKQYGISPKTLGWTKGRTRLRFEILSSQWDLRHAAVLDLGCGFGDFYGFLKQRLGNGFTYCGVDINPRFIEVARDQYPEAEFQVANIMDTPLDRRFDYGFASGLFNDVLEDNIRFVRAGLSRLNACCRMGFGANFLSNRVDYQRAHVFHVDPVWILELCYQYANNVVLRNDYMPYEFSVFVNTGTPIEPDVWVYGDFLPYM